jgi:ABC-type transporter Mla subunit MlaD
MEGRALYLRVGVMIVAGVALLLALLWFIGGNRFRNGTVYESYFSESVQGLEVGAPVKYRGVTVGRVTELGLVTAEYGAGMVLDFQRNTSRLVFVRFEVDARRIGRVPDTATAVSLGLRARLASQGLTGLTYLELDFVDPKQYPPLQVPWQPVAEYIPSMPSTLSQVQVAAENLLDKLNAVNIDQLAEQAISLLEDVRADIATGDVHRTLAEATALLRTTNEAVQVADLPGLSADIKSTSSALRNTVQGEKVQTLLSNASAAAARLAEASVRLPQLIASLQTTTQRIGNSTSDMEQGLVPVLRDVQATSQNLRELTDLLRRYPADVFSAPPPRNTQLDR